MDDKLLTKCITSEMLYYFYDKHNICHTWHMERWENIYGEQETIYVEEIYDRRDEIEKKINTRITITKKPPPIPSYHVRRCFDKDGKLLNNIDE